MPGLRYPKRIRERAKALWEQGLTLEAIAQQLRKEFGDFSPAFQTIGVWSKAWRSEGKAIEVAA